MLTVKIVMIHTLLYTDFCIHRNLPIFQMELVNRSIFKKLILRTLSIILMFVDSRYSINRNMLNRPLSLQIKTK